MTAAANGGAGGVNASGSNGGDGSIAICIFALVPAAEPVSAAGGVGLTFQVQTSGACAWTATSNDPGWISVTGGTPGTGTGTVTFSVAANPGLARTGTITAGGQVFTVNQAAAAISPLHRQALIDLYNSTAGAGWTDSTGWKTPPLDVDGFAMPGTECTWYGVTCSGGSVSQISLWTNNLVGTIPPSLGDLTTLLGLYLNGNALLGPIPATLGNLTNLQTLQLFLNGLTGPIPATLGNLYFLQSLDISRNQLSGPVPASFGFLSSLTSLYIYSNALNGPLPTGLANMGGLTWVGLGHNALFSTDAGLTAFLDSKQPGWQATQTVAPAGVAAGAPTSTSIPLTWTPIPYTGDSGAYEVHRGTTPGGPYTLATSTADKSASGATAAGLTPGTPYYFVVRTVTSPHASNTNTVVSDFSPEVSATTSACGYSLSSPGATIGAAGGAGQTFGVVTTAGCPWTATSNAPAWITVTGGTPGTGPGTVTYSVAANPGTARVGTITAAGQTFTVSQADGCAASATLSSTGSSPSAAGAVGLEFNVVATAGCPWTASSSVGWIGITGGASGTGPGTVTYNVAANSGPSRVGTITAAGRTFTVDQTSGCVASTTLSPTSSSPSASGASGLSFSVVATAGCRWSASSNDPTWITVTGGSSGTGRGTVTYSVAANPGSARVGRITAGGRPFTVQQAANCAASTSLSPTSETVPFAGGSALSFSIVTGATCPWTAGSGVSWITVATGSGTGPATVTYSVAPNTGPIRTGTITAAGRTFTVTQANGCVAGTVLSPESTSVVAKGAVGLSFQVSTGAACPWTAGSNVPWIQVVSGSSGTGPGTVRFDVGSNTGPERAGSVSAAGRTFAVRQATDCAVPSTPRLKSYPTAAVVAGNSFTVAWTPVENLPSSGFYVVRLSRNGDCSAPTEIATKSTSFTVTTEAGKTATYCLRVLANAGPNCPPGLVSSPSGSAVVQVRPLPAEFTVVQPMSPAARAEVGKAPPTGSTVVFRNIGASEGTLALSTAGGFFSASAVGSTTVPPGANVSVRIVFAADSTRAAGLRQGDLVGSWTAAEGRQSTSARVTLTVLAAPTQSTKGARLVPVGSNRVYFRKPAGDPPPQSIAIRNIGSLAVRVAPVIGPGGSWLSISGDFASLLSPGSTREFQLTVDRLRRTSDDGPPPLSTSLRFENVDGNPEDAAEFEVFDEEPPAPTAGTGRPEQTYEEFSLILGSSVSTTRNDPAGKRFEHTGAEYFSDGWIRNRGPDEIPVDLYFSPEGANGLDDPRVMMNSVSLAGYGSYRLSDFLQGLFGVTGSGHVELRSEQLPQLSIRSTVDSVVSVGGTSVQHGAELPLFVSGEGVARVPAAEAPLLAVLPGLKGPLAGFRSNVIFSETLGKPTEVHATLFDGAGHALGSKTLGMNPYSKVQVNYDDPSLFASPYAEASLVVEATKGDGAVAIFATVLDNASEAFIVRVASVLETSAPATAARSALDTAATVAFVPTAVREASTSSFYTTDLSVTNGSEAEVPLEVTYLPEAGLGEPVGPKPFLVPKREAGGGPTTVSVEDVLKSLFGLESDSKGMLRFEGKLDTLVFSSETSTPIDLAKPELGKSLSSVTPAPGVTTQFVGVFSRDSQEAVGVKQSSSDAVKQQVYYPAIEESAAFRTNLVLAELAHQPATVRVLLRKVGGALLGEPLVVTLGPNERREIGQVALAILKPPSGSADVAGAEIAVEAVEGLGRVVALVTKVSNDPASRRADTYVLGPPVAGSASRGGKK